MPLKWELQKMLDQKGITAYRLCKNTGLSYVTVNQIINGKVSGSISTLEKICDDLNCQPGDIIKRSDA